MTRGRDLPALGSMSLGTTLSPDMLPDMSGSCVCTGDGMIVVDRKVKPSAGDIVKG